MKKPVRLMLSASTTVLSTQMAIAESRSGAQCGRSKKHDLSPDHTFAPGFIACAEYRRDWSNQRHFLSDTSGSLLNAQTTATLGLMDWRGTKQGSW